MLRAQPQPGTLCAVSHGTLTPAWPIFYMQTQESLRYFPKITQHVRTEQGQDWNPGWTQVCWENSSAPKVRVEGKETGC